MKIRAYFIVYCFQSHTVTVTRLWQRRSQSLLMWHHEAVLHSWLRYWLPLSPSVCVALRLLSRCHKMSRSVSWLPKYNCCSSVLATDFPLVSLEKNWRNMWSVQWHGCSSEFVGDTCYLVKPSWALLYLRKRVQGPNCVISKEIVNSVCLIQNWTTRSGLKSCRTDSRVINGELKIKSIVLNS